MGIMSKIYEVGKKQLETYKNTFFNKDIFKYPGGYIYDPSLGIIVPESVYKKSKLDDPKYFLYLLLRTYWTIIEASLETIQKPIVQFTLRPLIDLTFEKIIPFCAMDEKKQTKVANEYYSIIDESNTDPRVIKKIGKNFPPITNDGVIEKIKKELSNHKIININYDNLLNLYRYFSQIQHTNPFFFIEFNDLDVKTKSYLYRQINCMGITGLTLIKYIGAKFPEVKYDVVQIEENFNKEVSKLPKIEDFKDQYLSTKE